MSNSICMLHTDRPATASCSECMRPLCQECTQLVANKPVCQSCITAIRSRVATQLNAEAAARPAQPTPVQPSGSPYGGSTPYGAPNPYASPAPQAAAPYAAPQRTDLSGNVYPAEPASGAAPYGAPAQPPYPGQQAPGYTSQAPYGAQPGYGAPASPPYGQPGYGAQQPPAGQPGYNPYGAAPQSPAGQQPGYSQSQSPYGAPQQGYPGGSRPPQTPAPAQTTTASGYILGIVLGLVAAGIGAGLYIWMISAMGISIGYMALGVGFLVGWAVKFGTRVPSPAAGIAAAALTVLAILPVRLLMLMASGNPGSLLFTLLFLFIGCRWAYGIASGQNMRLF